MEDKYYIQGLSRRYKIETFIEEDTRHKKHCAQDNDASVPFKIGTLEPHTVPVAISCPVVFSWISLTIWNLFPFKGYFSFGEMAEVAGHQIWAVEGLSHLGDLMFCKKNSAGDVMHEWMRCCDEAASHQLPIAAAFWIIPIVSHGGMFKLNATFEADSLLYSLSHFECDGHTIHMLTQWHLPPPLTSTVKSLLFTHAYSSPLSLGARLHRCARLVTHKLFPLY